MNVGFSRAFCLRTIVAAKFEWDANAYEDVSQVQLNWGKALLETHEWRGDERVLDAGCGTGALGEEILQRIPKGELVAVDHDTKMVEAATPRLAKHGERARVFAADLLALPPTDPFDLIFSNAVIHWIQDHDKLFLEFFRHLKPGGHLIAQGGGEGNLQRVRSVTESLRRDAAYASYFRDWKAPWNYEDDSSTEERLLITGFVDSKVSLTPAPITFPDDRSFAKFANAVILRPYLGVLPTPQLRLKLLEDFVARMKDEGNLRTLDYVRLTIHARRPPHVS